MSKELSDALLAVLKQSAAVAQEQLPLVLQEQLRYGFYDTLLGLAFGVCMTVGGIKLFRLASKMKAEKESYERETYFVGEIFAASLSVLGGIIGLLEVSSLAQILLAPRVYLLEWAMRLAR